MLYDIIWIEVNCKLLSEADAMFRVYLGMTPGTSQDRILRQIYGKGISIYCINIDNSYGIYTV